MDVLSEHERWVIIEALRLASEQYLLDAQRFQTTTATDLAENAERMAAGFAKQAAEAAAMLSRLESAEDILVRRHGS